MLRLSLHPDGMAPRIVNLGEWRAHLLGRLRRQVASRPTRRWRRCSTSCAATRATRPEPRAPAGTRRGGAAARPRTATASCAFFSTVATFGTPIDVTVAELAIESFFPADPATAEALRGLMTG